MELHLLPTFICLILAPVVIDAALPPELYWKSMLPNTTMPKSVKYLLRAGNVGKAIYDEPNNQKVTDQLHDNLNNQISFRQRVTSDQLDNNPNQKFLWQHDQLDNNPNQKFIWQHDPLDNDPNQKFRWQHDQLDNNPNQKFIWQRDVVDQFTTDQLDNDPNQKFLWQHDIVDQQHDNPNNPIIFGQRATIDQLHDNLIINQLHHNPNSQMFIQQRTATDQSLDDWTKFLFLSENDLHPGKKLDMLFTKSPYSTVLIPGEVADTIPFSLEKLPEILKMFFVEPMSKEAQIIKRAIHHCEARTKGEEKHCVTSLESMIDYIISKLGKSVKAYSTEVEKETQLQTYTIAPGVKKISDEIMACHQAHYPYVLFHCHKVGGSNRAYFVPLEGSDGTRVKAIVVCHSDTSDWDADHVAFRTLKIKPGTAPVCHFSPPDNVIWTPHMAA